MDDDLINWVLKTTEAKVGLRGFKVWGQGLGFRVRVLYSVHSVHVDYEIDHCFKFASACYSGF